MEPISLFFLCGTLISSELWIMRIFSVTSWAHFGSMVVGIAMLAFGASSVLLSIKTSWFQKHINRILTLSLLLFAPLLMASNAFVQKISFNPLFLASDPEQKWNLLFFFLAYFIPFFSAAFFVGLFFLKHKDHFGKMYFADMTGSGFGGILFLLSLWVLPPPLLFLVPLFLYLCAAVSWILSINQKHLLAPLFLTLCLSLFITQYFTHFKISAYKGVSYAKRFPDAHKVYESQGPEGWMQIYSSSYFHFAPGLSDNAGFMIHTMPENAYLGIYIDGDGPMGLMRRLDKNEEEYFNYLPLSLPYLIQPSPDKVLLLQMGGGIAAQVALFHQAKHITITEPNRLMIQALRDDPQISRYSGNFLSSTHIHLLNTDGRLYLQHIGKREKIPYQLIDLSFADSTGLSMPAGLSIHEKYLYTEENFSNMIEALANDGILSVTLWNKEHPPKSTLKVLSTFFQAARANQSTKIADQFFITHTYLSTLSILYKRSGFTAEDIQKLTENCRKLSFEILYAPGMSISDPQSEKILESYRSIYFEPQNDNAPENLNLKSGHLYSLLIQSWIRGESPSLADRYIFDTQPLTNSRPYLAGFVQLKDLWHFLKNLELVSDEWGTLLLWIALAIASVLALGLLLIPVIVRWKDLFSQEPGKISLFLYFISLGLGYIIVELSLMSQYQLCLENPTLSISLLITGMLFFSGLGSLASTTLFKKWNPSKLSQVTALCIVIGLLLHILCGSSVLTFLGQFPLPTRLLGCLLLMAPLAFCMGFPFSLGMSKISQKKNSGFFVWAWGLNGCFSVIASLLTPLLSVYFGLSLTLGIAMILYIGIPFFYERFA